jgi:hypothetical protein
MPEINSARICCVVLRVHFSKIRTNKKGPDQIGVKISFKGRF